MSLLLMQAKIEILPTSTSSSSFGNSYLPKLDLIFPALHEKKLENLLSLRPLLEPNPADPCPLKFYSLPHPLPSSIRPIRQLLT